MAAASALGDIGCSTKEKRFTASSPSSMNQTPMEPINPAMPSRGPTTRELMPLRPHQSES